MSKILLCPDGEPDERVLFDTIDAALQQGLLPTERISFLVKKRAPWFNSRDPQYEIVNDSRTLRTLMDWHKNMTGREFDPKSSRPLPAGMLPVFIHNPKTGATILCDIGS